MRVVVLAVVGAMAKDSTHTQQDSTPNKDRTLDHTPHRTPHRIPHSTPNRGSTRKGSTQDSNNIQYRAADTAADTATDMDTVKNITKVEKGEKVKKSVMKRRKRSIRTRSKINVSHHHNQDHLSSPIIIVD